MDNLVTIRTYANMYNVTPVCVYKWEKQNKIKTTQIDGVKFVILTDEEVKQRQSLFSQHPTKGLHKISEIMDAMLNNNQEYHGKASERNMDTD